MYDLTWKYRTPEEMAESGKALGRLVQQEVAAVHGPRAWMRGVAVFDEDKRLVDLRVVSVSEDGSNQATILDDDNPDECDMAPMERAVKASGCTDFILWTYGDDEGTKDMTVIGPIYEAAQTIIDLQAPHGIALRGAIYIGRTDGVGAAVLTDQLGPTIGSPTFMYLSAKQSLEIELKQAPDDRSQVIIDAMTHVMDSYIKHVPYDTELMKKARDVSADRIRARVVQDPAFVKRIPPEIARVLGIDKQRQPDHRAASPFDLPGLKPPKPEKGLLN